MVSTSVDWTNCTHGVESRNESNAVLPNSTDTTPTSPGRTTTVERLASGLRTRSRPSSCFQTDSFDSRVEYTSNGSALS